VIETTDMIRHDEVCVLIPTYNESETISDVIEGFRDGGFEHILVMDGYSDDDTREVAEEAGARVEIQSGEGKGQAVREAMDYISQPYVLMVDGDSTYRPDEAEQMLAPLFSGEAQHVLGNRFANMESGAMSRLNQTGNSIINKAFRVIHGRDLQDILSGYRAFTRDSFERLSLSATGFGIETEMAVECVRKNIRTTVVPITYEPRPDESETNLRPFRDGGSIIFTLYQLAKKNNPLFYFGSLGAVSMLIAVGLALFVLFRYFIHDTSHEVVALASGVALLFGVQLIMFGVLSDLILTSNREQSQRIEHLVDEVEYLRNDAGRVRARSDEGQVTAERESSATETSGEDTETQERKT
jgi:glycosyltransferase (TIGR04182 family)